MQRMQMHSAVIVGLALLSGFLVTGDLIAQNPKTPAPAGITPRTTPTPIQPQPISRPRPKSEVELRGNLAPDLELSFAPASGAAPNRFTVENKGLGDARNSSLLRVSVRLLPLDTSMEPLRWLDRSTTNTVVALLAESLGEFCPLPYPDFQAAIDPLDAGESHAVTQSGARVGEGIQPVGYAAARPSIRVRDHSYVRDMELRLVCVFELRATVDANGEVDEYNERNNEVVHTFQREVTF